MYYAYIKEITLRHFNSEMTVIVSFIGLRSNPDQISQAFHVKASSSLFKVPIQSQLIRSISIKHQLHWILIYGTVRNPIIKINILKNCLRSIQDLMTHKTTLV